jgi:hypothetical protein
MMLAMPPGPLLPATLGGWTAEPPVQTGTDPRNADPENASVLKEYGLQRFATAEYRRGGAAITLKAMQFVDATGAYGAFTFYRKTGMRTEDIGREAASDSHEVVFWSGLAVVDATAHGMGAAEKKMLAALSPALPRSAGPEGTPPSLARYLPAASLEKSSIHYAIGPDAYVKAGGVLPPGILDFSRDAEAITASYPHRSGTGTLTILEYPTPQIAGDRANAIEAMLKGSSLPPALQHGNPRALSVKRSGPLVAITSGDMSGEEAASLLDKVRYGAALTWNHPEGYTNEVRKTARLLVGIAALTGILGGAAVLLGLFLGGGRALLRVARGKGPSVLNDDDFISLKLGR